MISLKQVLVLLMLMIQSNESLNSYIYLPDKYIHEEISIGSLIVDIADELDKQKSTTNSINNHDSSNEMQHFTFLEDVKSSTENTYYLIDSITGRITSKRYLDRESMCMNKHCMEQCDQMTSSSFKQNATLNCKMNLKVLLIPSYDIVNLNIIIQDLNDNKPQFRIDLINQTIPENVPIGYKIPIDLAYDPDAGINSIQNYTLLSLDNENHHNNNATFQLVQQTLDSELALIVKKKLDREKIAQYNLSISACDGGVPSSCGQLRIILNLMDINDHNPIFSKDIYSFNVLENMPVGTLIGQVYAFDADDGINGKVKYSLIGFNGRNTDNDNADTNDNNDKQSNYFSLDSQTGALTLNKALLDYETEQHFSLTVEARDYGAGSLPAYATIDIYVQDENDNMPEISVSFFNTLQRNGTNIFLKENYEPNKFLALVSLADRDSGENARLDWKLNVNNEEIIKSSSVSNNNQLLSLNVLNANSFTINTGMRSNILFDREKNEYLNVTILSWDYGEHTNMAAYTFMIYLLDENDNAPSFDKSEYNLNLNENNEINKIIYRFNATDLDLNENAHIVYMLEFLSSDLDQKFVQIDETTGILRANQVFDREFKDTYSFYVIARDSSIDLNKRLWTKVKCTLSILDLNDNRPQISFNNTAALPYKEYSNKTLVVLNLDENIPLNTILIEFACTDFDSNANGRVKLTLNYLKNLQQQQQQPFKLTDSGQLIVEKKLDREFIDLYQMQIVCSDQADNKLKRLNTTLQLNIKLNDVNDNCPRSLNSSAQLSFYTEDYLENTLTLQARTKFINRNLLIESINITDLFVVNYTDSDIGKNGELSFQLQTHTDLFSIVIDQQQTVGYMHSHLLIYTIRIQLKANVSHLLKIGKYLIKLKINDNGYPSCIKVDTFILYVGGGEEATTQLDLIDLLKSIYTLNKRTDENALNADFINDQDDQDSYDDLTNGDEAYSLNANENNQILKSLIQHSPTPRPAILSLFKSSQYVIIFIVIATLLLIALMLSSICLIYCFRRRSRKLRSKKSLSVADTLKVKNYRSSSSSNSSTNSSNSDLNNHRISNTSTEEENITNSRVHDLIEDEDLVDNKTTETKNLLANNRYSLNTDNSNSANSVACNSNQLQNNNNNIKPIIYDQNLKNSVSFLSSSSSSSITPPYISYRQMKPTTTDSSTVHLNHHRFMNDNGTLPNYIRVNRNYQFQQYQRSIMEENNKNNNRTFMKSFPYNQVNNSQINKIDIEKRNIISNNNNKSSLNDSTTSSTSSSSSSQMMVTPSTASDCSEIIIVPTTTTSILTSSTSPSSVSSSSSSSSSSSTTSSTHIIIGSDSTECVKYKQYGEFNNIKNRPNINDINNDNETTACLYNNDDSNNNRTHFLRSSAV